MSDITWRRTSGRTHVVTIWRDGEREAHAEMMARYNSERGMSWLEIGRLASQSNALQAMSEEQMARYNSDHARHVQLSPSSYATSTAGSAWSWLVGSPEL